MSTGSTEIVNSWAENRALNKEHGFAYSNCLCLLKFGGLGPWLSPCLYTRVQCHMAVFQREWSIFMQRAVSGLELS